MQPTSLLAFHRKFRSYDMDSSAGPDIIHCSAGVGRTGTFIALDHLLKQAKAEGVVDVLYCVRQMRQARYSMIQTQVCVPAHFQANSLSLEINVKTSVHLHERRLVLIGNARIKFGVILHFVLFFSYQ